MLRALAANPAHIRQRTARRKGFHIFTVTERDVVCGDLPDACYLAWSIGAEAERVKHPGRRGISHG